MSRKELLANRAPNTWFVAKKRPRVDPSLYVVRGLEVREPETWNGKFKLEVAFVIRDGPYADEEHALRKWAHRSGDPCDDGKYRGAVGLELPMFFNVERRAAGNCIGRRTKLYRALRLAYGPDIDTRKEVSPRLLIDRTFIAKVCDVVQDWHKRPLDDSDVYSRIEKLLVYLPLADDVDPEVPF